MCVPMVRATDSTWRRSAEPSSSGGVPTAIIGGKRGFGILFRGFLVFAEHQVGGILLGFDGLLFFLGDLDGELGFSRKRNGFGVEIEAAALLELVEALGEVVLDFLDGLLDLLLVVILGQLGLEVDELLELGLGIGDALEGEAEGLDFALSGDGVANVEFLFAGGDDRIGLEVLGGGELGELFVRDRGGNDGLGGGELVGAFDAEAIVELGHRVVIALELVL